MTDTATDSARGSLARGSICSYADPRCDFDGDLCRACGRAWCWEHWEHDCVEDDDDDGE